MPLSHPLLDLADLVLGRTCLGCGAVGRELCANCLQRCRARPRLLPVPTGAATAWVAGPYSGPVRSMVLAYKDGQRSLAQPLGTLLADAVDAALADAGQRAGFLVRVPGHRRPSRGFDALGLVVRHATIDLQRRGLIAPALGMLVRHRDHRPTKRLTRSERFAELTDAFVALPSRAEVGLPRHLPLIVVDDVMTSGATLAEAVRAMRAVGMPPHVAAVIAAAGHSGPARQPG
jgi:predicted amidophosphoribosyltransferase